MAETQLQEQAIFEIARKIESRERAGRICNNRAARALN